jgi:hypothetical protein
MVEGNASVGTTYLVSLCLDINSSHTLEIWIARSHRGIGRIPIAILARTVCPPFSQRLCSFGGGFPSGAEDDDRLPL